MEGSMTLWPLEIPMPFFWFTLRFSLFQTCIFASIYCNLPFSPSFFACIFPPSSNALPTTFPQSPPCKIVSTSPLSCLFLSLLCTITYRVRLITRRPPPVGVVRPRYTELSLTCSQVVINSHVHQTWILQYSICEYRGRQHVRGGEIESRFII